MKTTKSQKIEQREVMGQWLFPHVLIPTSKKNLKIKEKRESNVKIINFQNQKVYLLEFELKLQHLNHYSIFRKLTTLYLKFKGVIFHHSPHATPDLPVSLRKNLYRHVSH